MSAAAGPPDPPPPLSPHDMKALRDSVNDTAKHFVSRSATFLFVTFFIAVAVNATTDEQLLKDEPLPLPLLGLSLGIKNFYLFMPWIYVAFHAYVMLEVVLMAEKVRTFLAHVPAADRERELRTLFPLPQLQRLAGDVQSLAKRCLIDFVNTMTLVIIPVLLLLGMLWRFLPYHHEYIHGFQRAAIVVDLALLWLARSLLRRHYAGLPRDEPSADARGEPRWWSWRLPFARVLGPLLAPITVVVLFACLLARWAAQFDRLSAVGTAAVLAISFTLFVVPGRMLDVLPYDGELGWEAPEALDFNEPALRQWRKWAEDQLHRNLNIRKPLISDSYAKELEPKLEQVEVGRVAAASQPADAVARVKFKELVDALAPDLRRRGLSLAGRDLRNAKLEFAELYGADLSGADLSGADLSNARLLGAELAGARLHRVDLHGAQLAPGALNRVRELERAYLARLDLTGTDFSVGGGTGANLRGAQLYSAILNRVRMRGAELRGAKLWEAELDRADLHEAELEGADLHSAKLRGADLRRAKLQGADLREAQLHGADLREAQLHGAYLREAQFHGADLSRAKLHVADLSGAKLHAADVWDADLHGAHLDGAELQGANLGGAQLHGADLSSAILHGAVLRGAELHGAVLWRAEFHGADLRFAQLHGTDLSGASLAWCRLDGMVLATPPRGNWTSNYAPGLEGGIWWFDWRSHQPWLSLTAQTIRELPAESRGEFARRMNAGWFRMMSVGETIVIPDAGACPPQNWIDGSTPTTALCRAAAWAAAACENEWIARAMVDWKSSYWHVRAQRWVKSHGSLDDYIAVALARELLARHERGDCEGLARLEREYLDELGELVAVRPEIVAELDAAAAAASAPAAERVPDSTPAPSPAPNTDPAPASRPTSVPAPRTKY